MNFEEISKAIDKSESNECYIDINNISNELDRNYCYISNMPRFKSYWIGRWLCTDTTVGYRMYFLDDIPVCWSHQSARKSSEIIEWISEELALKVRDYLDSLSDNENELQLNLVDQDFDFGKFYKISFNGQVQDWNNMTLNGEKVKFIKRIIDTPNYGIDKNLIIEKLNGEQLTVNITDLDFGFNIIK